MSTQQDTQKAEVNLHLGRCHEEGVSVPKDQTKAVKYYTKSAELGNTEALFHLGCCYGAGEGIKQDFDKAFEYISKSVTDYEASQPQETQKWYTIALCNLADCYYNGLGVTKDLEKGKEFYTKSANLGFTNAIEALKTIVD